MIREIDEKLTDIQPALQTGTDADKLSKRQKEKKGLVG